MFLPLCSELDGKLEMDILGGHGPLAHVRATQPVQGPDHTLNQGLGGRGPGGDADPHARR